MLRAIRVLVVDDDPRVRESVVGLLGAFGMEASTAHSGHAALAQCEGECPFDVVVSDVVMPEMSGVQLAEALRKRHPGVPVILMTGRESMIDGAIQAGAVPLFKPFTALQLKSVIDDALEAT